MDRAISQDQMPRTWYGKRGKSPLAGCLVLFGLVGVLLIWNASFRFDEFVAHQQELATASVAAAASEAALLLEEKRRSAALFAAANQGLFRVVTDAPGDKQGRTQLTASLETHFPDHIGYALTDEAGNPRIADPLGLVGEGCREAIRRFARQGEEDQTKTHRSPGGKPPHFDVMSGWTRWGTNDSVFFISFETSALVRILRNRQVAGHQLMLVTGDDATLIDLTADGDYKAPARPRTLSSRETARLVSAAPVAGSSWQLVDLPGPALFSNTQRSIWRQNFLVLVAILVLAVFVTRWVWREECKRVVAERALRKAYDDLDRLVQERTQELAASERRYHSLFDDALEMIHIVDENDVIVDANRAELRRMGYSRDEYCGTPCMQRVHADCRDQCTAVMERVRTGERINGLEAVFVTRDGENIEVEVNIVPQFRDGKVVAARVISRDVTERKRAEQLLGRLVEGTAAVVGEDFFASLVQQLCQVLGAHYAYVAEGVDGSVTRLRSLAFWAGDRIADNIEYEIANTPCELVVTRNAVYYPENVQALFPEGRSLAELGVKSFLGAPIIGSKGQIMGCLVVMDVRPMRHDEAKVMSIAKIFAARAGVELERIGAESSNEALRKRNQRLARHAMTVQEAERRELARELHDELGQSLTAIQAYAQLISNLGTEEHPDVVKSANKISEVSEQVQGAIGSIMQRLRPALLDDLGLRESIQEMVEQWQDRHPDIHCELRMDGGLNTLTDQLNITAYRIVQEALTNIAKHGRASQVVIEIGYQTTANNNSLRILIEDNGVGLSGWESNRGLGLLGMSERTLALGGELEIEGRPGVGVRIVAEIPVSAAQY